MKGLHGTRFTKAAVPTRAGALNLTNRIIGQNKRKQKLTEAAGTNPAKLGAVGLGKSGSSGTLKLVQDTAPHKHEAVDYPIGVGGPGFDELTPKVPK